MARTSRKLLLFGAAVVAAGVFLKRDKVAGLLPGRGQTYEPPAPPPPGPSNYDAPGPVANTATPVPAPEPQQPGAIDEAAEEAAAAAEAANIGGTVSDYAGPSDLPATEAERPLAEAGEGEAEGQEQAEFDLRTAAEPTAPGMSDTERQIDEAIEQAANPLAGEQLEGVRPAEDPRGDTEAVPPAETPPAESPEESAWSPPVPERSDEPAPFAEEPSGEPVQYEPPTQEQPAVTPPSEDKDEEKPSEDKDEEKPKDEEGGSDWRTWSGRSINP
jgi:hypothetical protein